MNLAWFSLENEDGTATSSPLINFNGRPIAVIRIGDQNIPFYRSTGTGGKDPGRFVPNKWYPFWGYNAPGQWFIKNEEMENYYGIPELEEISKQLDTLTDGLPKLRASNEWRSVANIETGQMDDDFRGLINGTAFRNADSLYNRRDITNHITVSKKKTRDEIRLMKRDALKSPKMGEQPDSGERFSSGAKYQEIVDAQKPLSKEKKKSISEFAEDLSGEEFQKEDVYKLDDGPKPPRPPGMPEPKPVLIIQDDEKRAKEKRRVHESLAKIFEGEMELDKDVIITAEDGTQLNIGKKVLVEVVPKADWAPGAKIKRFSKDDASEQDELGLYDATIEEGDLMTELQLEFRIKPLPEYNDRLIATFSDEDKRRYVSRDDGTPAIATSYRTLMQISGDDKDIKLISHDSFYVTGRAQGQGIGSAFNARNEQIYKELDVRSIFTEGSSGGGSTGAVHWPKNGFTWAGEKDKQKFMKVIDDAITEKPELFSEEERKKISSLYSKNPDTGMFETEATAEELVSFTEAKKVFADVDALILYTRPLREFAGASSGNRFSSGATGQGKAARSSKEILDEATGLGIEWQGKTIGTSKEEVDRRVSSSAKMLKKSKELGLTDVPELSDEIKKIFNDYADGKISLKGMREAILFTDPKDEKLRQWAFGKEQLPIGWRVAAAREIAISQNDAELVKKIDDFIAFMGDIDNVSDEELEELIRKASVDFGKNMGSPIIQTPDVKRIIRGAGGVTVHDSDERKLDNLSGTTGMGESLTISARRRAETMYGLPFTGENTPEDRAITAMRPISGHSLPKDSHLAREKRMKKIYGEDFVTMYDFPIGSDVADLSQTAKYGRSHIILSDAVNERTKVVNGDAVSRFGSDGAAVAELESVGEAGISYADPFGMLFSSMTGDSGASIAGPLDPSFAYAGKYNETATLGTFDPSEVRAVYIADIGQTRRDIGDVPQGINPDFYGNLSVIFDFARTRDEILDSRGTELVAQIGEPRGTNGQMGVLEYLHPENVELFNSSMTSAWLDRYENIFGEIPREILIPEDEPGTTPYEAYLRAKINQLDKNGVGALKENAATFGEKRDGREFGLEVLEEELARAVTARKNRTASGERFSSGATGRSSAEPASAEGPRANKPKRVKKYKGYELKEPDNPEPKPGEFPDDVVEAAKKHRAEIEKVEAEITKLLIDLAEKNNARMEGLDFRLKALKSLMRKIAAEKDSEHGGDAQKAAEAMSDVVRYTMSYGEEDYVDGVKDVVEQMQKLGYDLRIKNYWQSDDPYQGINVAVTHPDGTKFELQFHTPQSVAEKEKIHLMYEDYRGSTDPKQRWELYQKMVEIANKIGVPVPPEELLSIGEIKVQPFS